jgi:hypothetical protein
MVAIEPEKIEREDLSPKCDSRHIEQFSFVTEYAWLEGWWNQSSSLPYCPAASCVRGSFLTDPAIVSGHSNSYDASYTKSATVRQFVG